MDIDKLKLLDPLFSPSVSFSSLMDIDKLKRLYDILYPKGCFSSLMDIDKLIFGSYNNQLNSTLLSASAGRGVFLCPEKPLRCFDSQNGSEYNIIKYH